MSKKQSELPGMPAAKVSPTWLAVCETAIDDLALAWVWIDTVAMVPNMVDGNDEAFRVASERFARAVMQEVGRAAWQVAVNKAVLRFNALMRTAARRRAP